MNKSLVPALITVALLSGTAFAASSEVEVRLILDEKNILPATPTGLRIAVVNHGEEPLHLPGAVSLVARDAVGKMFTLHEFNMTGSLAAPVPEEVRVVPARGSQELRFDPSNAVAGSPWLMDERLWKPGSYRLRAVLASEIRPDGTFDAGTSLVSDEETLTVVGPTGEDATVWAWMQGQKWNEQAWMMRGGDLAKFIIPEHSQSQYTLFVARFVPQSDGPAPLHAELVARFPNHSFTDQVRLLQVHGYKEAAGIAYRQKDLYHSANDWDQARTIASGLVRNSRSAKVRALAKDLLDRMPTRDQVTKKPEAP